MLSNVLPTRVSALLRFHAAPPSADPHPISGHDVTCLGWDCRSVSMMPIQQLPVESTFQINGIRCKRHCLMTHWANLEHLLAPRGNRSPLVDRNGWCYPCRHVPTLLTRPHPSPERRYW